MPKDVDINLVSKYLNGFFPTDQDLNRSLDSSEQMELCMRVSCRVRMTKWNIVEDCKKTVSETKQGRKRPLKDEDVLKHINSNKGRYKGYSQREIDEVRKREWAERKKKHLLKLEIWKQEREAQKGKEASTKRQKLESIEGVGPEVKKTALSKSLKNHPLNQQQVTTKAEKKKYTKKNPKTKIQQLTQSTDVSLNEEVLEDFMKVKSSELPIETPIRKRCPAENYAIFSPTIYTEDFNEAAIPTTSTQIHEDEAHKDDTLSDIFST